VNDMNLHNIIKENIKHYILESLST